MHIRNPVVDNMIYVQLSEMPV